MLLSRPLLAFVAAAGLAAAAAGLAAQTPARIQQLLDAGRPEEALEQIRSGYGRRPKDPRALLLRSTARLMLGEMEEGRRDLDRALELDPGLRQGWLNRAALDIAEQRYEAALGALRTAERLDPEAADNGLNLGAVLLLLGRPEEAGPQFSRYLAAEPTAAAHFLVATNYATAGLAPQAVAHLGEAVRRDERMRLEARGDPRFLRLAADPGLRALLDADPPPPPAGASVAEQRFSTPYAGGQGKLLAAVLDALQLAGETIDPRVEVTPTWAVVWGEVRVEVRAAADGGGLVRLSAPPGRFSPGAWRQRSEGLFRRIQARLAAAG